MRSILVVDDDPEIADLVSTYMESEGFRAVQAHDGTQALSKLETEHIDLIILDVMLPELDGLQVCQKIRTSSTVPILMLSARAEDMDKILGLMTGADDYMIKPFNPLELAARIKSLLRRSIQYNSADRLEAEEILRVHSVDINRLTHTVTVHGNDVALTSREFEILFLLASHPGRVFGAEEIFQVVWKEKYYNSNNTVMVHISNLREKLDHHLGYKLIQTIWGVGYKIDA